MRSNTDVIVICGLDSHIERIKVAVDNTKKCIGDIDVAVASYGNHQVPKSKILPKFCVDNNICYYDDDRIFTKPVKHNNNNEILHLMRISLYFYKMGYNNVYLIQNDMFIVRDFRKIYDRYKIDKWSFIAPFIDVNDPYYKENADQKFKKLIGLNSKHILYATPYRIRLTIVIFNYNFLNVFFDKFPGESSVDLMCNDDRHSIGDVSLFDFFADDLSCGYNVSVITSMIGLDMAYCLETAREFIAKNNNICYVHGLGTYDFFKDKYVDWYDG